MIIQQNHQESQLNKKLTQFITAFIFELAEHEQEINKLSSYFSHGDLGTRLNKCLQKFEQIIKQITKLDYVFLANFAVLIKNIIGDKIGDMLSFWLANFLRYWYYFTHQSERVVVVECLYNATIELGQKFKLKVKDKSFYSILLPCVKVIYANISSPIEKIKTELIATLNRNIVQNISCRSYCGKGQYLGKRSSFVLDPGAYVVYLAFKTFIKIT